MTKRPWSSEHGSVRLRFFGSSTRVTKCKQSLEMANSRVRKVTNLKGSLATVNIENQHSQSSLSFVTTRYMARVSQVQALVDQVQALMTELAAKNQQIVQLARYQPDRFYSCGGNSPMSTSSMRLSQQETVCWSPNPSPAHSIAEWGGSKRRSGQGPLRSSPTNEFVFLLQKIQFHR